MVDNLEIPAKIRKYEEQRESLKQNERTKQALSQEYVNLDERSFEDLVRQIALYSKQVLFYEGSDSRQSHGNWESFFKEYYDGETFDMEHLKEIMSKGNVPPHLSLILAFLKLYQIQQGEFNNLLTRHLDFYYKDVLGFTQKKGYAGKAVVFPTLDKNVNNILIPKGTLLDAGKDKNGKSIKYATSEDFVPNHAKIATYMAYVNDEEILRNEGRTCGNYDPDFGNPTSLSIGDGSIASGKYCLAITSPKLVVPDGIMIVTLKNILTNWLDGVEYTGKKGWSTATIAIGEPNDGNSPCQFTIDMEADPMIPYNKGIHGEGFDTEGPIVRLVLKDSSVVQNITHNTFADDIIVCVSGCKNVTIENKYGLVDNTPGAVLFGGNSGISDYFTVKAPHNGEITRSSCSILLDYYYNKSYGHYNKESLYGSSITSYFINSRPVYIVKNAILSMETWYKDTMVMVNGYNDSDPESNVWAFHEGNDMRYSLCHNYYNQQAAAKRMADSAINKTSGGISDFILSIPTLKSPIEIDYSFNIAYSELNIYPMTPFGIGEQIIITPVWPESSDQQDSTTPIEEPVSETDVIPTDGEQSEQGTSDEASNPSNDSAINDESTASTEEEVQQPNEETLDENPATEEQETTPPDDPTSLEDEVQPKQNNLSPNIFDASYAMDFGENHILMGIEGIDSPCVINIYFKINPYVQHAFYETSWYYLSGNQWNKFSFDKEAKVIKDTTHNLRQNGIVTLQLDENIFIPHTCLPEDKLWLKLNLQCTSKSDDKSDRIGFDVNSIEEIRTQGVEVEYCEDPEVKMDFSSKLKAGTISKLVSPIQGVKKIEQPFEGDRGRNDETDEQFHARVSEILRHKGKAWNGSDYESLIMASFPEIAAAKYLPCRNMDGLYEAGHVYVMLAPDPLVENQPEPRKPKITWNVLYEIYEEVKQHATTFAQNQIHVMEPIYDELNIKCGYTPNEGYDNPYYGKLISDELVKFIAPWSDNEHIVDFNRKLTPNDIVYFIESLPYVKTVDEIYMNIKLEHELPVYFRKKKEVYKDLIIYNGADINHDKKCEIKEKNYDLDMDIKPFNITHVITSAAEHNIYIKKQSDDTNK